MTAALPEISSQPVSAARQQLLQRIRARYRTVSEAVRVGPLSFPFTRIADPDRVLDEVAAEEDRLEKVSGRRADGDYLHLPYWAELWDSAMGIGHWLTDNVRGNEAAVRSDYAARTPFAPPPLRPLPPSVLDLGCGMGLSGTVAAALGARVLFADLETPALLFARLNSLPSARRVRTRLLDWRRDRLGERFDLILGADILYERKQWEHLEPFWRAHLAPGGTVLLGEPGRPAGDAFSEWASARGWALRTEERPVPSRPGPIRLFLLTLPHGSRA